MNGSPCQELAYGASPYRSLFFLVIQTDANAKKNEK
jgi:hypothetical protein